MNLRAGACKRALPAMEVEKLHIVMLPFLGFGHINPFLQLARKISSSTSSVGTPIRITFLTSPGNVARITSLLPSPTTIEVLPLTMPAIPGLPPDAGSTADVDPSLAGLLHLALELMEPQVTDILSRLKPHLLLYEFATPWIPKVASQLNIKTVFYSIFAAISTAYLTVPARASTSSVDDLCRAPDEFPASSAMTTIPMYQGADLLYMFKPLPGGNTIYNKVMTGLEGCHAIVARTCLQMEEQYIKYAESQLGKRILLAGPVVPEPESGVLEDKWEDWLGGFAQGSVVYFALGSEAVLSDHAATELVLGLEMTGLPFIAVLKGGDAVKLPEELEERVRGKGVIHRGWVQQQLIIRHQSVGCFLTHAGLSSLMEGLVADCQLVLLPQFGDQFPNAALFAGDLKIAVEVMRNPVDGSFGRDAISEAVRKVTGEEGAMVRENHRRWREFITDSNVHDKFTEDLVEELKVLAAE